MESLANILHKIIETTVFMLQQIFVFLYILIQYVCRRPMLRYALYNCVERLKIHFPVLQSHLNFCNDESVANSVSFCTLI